MKLLNPIPENRPSARIALNHKYFENLAYENSNDNLSSDLESESDEELPNSPPKMQLKDFSLAYNDSIFFKYNIKIIFK